MKKSNHAVLKIPRDCQGDEEKPTKENRSDGNESNSAAHGGECCPIGCGPFANGKKSQDRDSQETQKPDHTNQCDKNGKSISRNVRGMFLAGWTNSRLTLKPDKSDRPKVLDCVIGPAVR